MAADSICLIRKCMSYHRKGAGERSIAFPACEYASYWYYIVFC